MIDQVTYLAGEFNLFALLQIVIVSLVIYIGLSVFQNTLADILLRGVLVLVLLLFVMGVFFQFPLTTWLANAAPSLILMVAVVFAPEIRRVLERLGRSSTTLGFAWHFGAWEDEQTIAAITRTASELSRRSWGGLVVIERDVGLADYAGTGTEIGGRLSAALLLSIFFPNSELHDLAVIIRGRTVLSAGSILPMTAESTSARHLGSRHRAALGITEVTDAVAVVVSEETGGIALAADGKLAQHLTEEQLRRRLQAILAPSRIQRRRRWIHRPSWLVRNQR